MDVASEEPIGRRTVMRLGLAAAAISGFFPRMPSAANTVVEPQGFDYGNPGQLSPRAIRLVSTTNTIDMLTQVRNALVVRGGANSQQMVPARFRRWFDDPKSITRDDLRRYLQSGIRIFYPGTDTAITTNFTDRFAAAQWYFNGWFRIRATHPDLFAFLLSPDDLSPARHRGKLKIILGMQNGDHFRSGQDVGLFYRLGQRVSQLTYNSENKLGGGAFSDAALKPLGREVIAAMNHVGMVLDLSHANERTAFEAADASAVAPIISHTNCEKLNPGFNRAATDALIRAVASRGGVVGMTVVRNFVSPREPTTIEDYLNHIDHVAQLVGVQHVGLGSDTDLSQIDGADPAAFEAARKQAAQAKYKWRDRTEIDGLDHPRRIYDVCEGLVRRGYTDRDIRLVLGGNWERVLSHIWSTRSK